MNIGFIDIQLKEVFALGNVFVSSYGAALAFGSGTALVVLVVCNCEYRETVFWKWYNPECVRRKRCKTPKVSIYRSSKQEVEEHNFISLVCVARDFYPEHVKIKWLVNDVERVNLYEPVPQKTSDGSSYSTSKRLTLTRSEYFNPESKFECQAAFPNYTISRAEVRGEKDCSISKETYTIHINQGKISYIMILCKSGLYALVVLALLWRKKLLLMDIADASQLLMRLSELLGKKPLGSYRTGKTGYSRWRHIPVIEQ
ncbi:unnamed protein product, partial [Ranitomeya imitator]